jgi:arylsulfatase A-like enzyme/Flp pilus assembly protein TadD
MFFPSCLLSLAIACLLAFAHTAAGQRTPVPNLVVITIDTLRADHLGCYGNKQVRTPNIDALAAEGFQFTRAYTSVPVTLPSHAVIFTGTYPMFSGMHDFAGNKLAATEPTLASVLQANGYDTGAVVGSAVLDSRFGLNHGFDFYYDHFNFNRLQESNIEEMARPGNLVADIALDWLKQHSQKKFFLWMHLYDPHLPYRLVEPYKTQYKDHPYDGEIAFADEQVGRVIEFLKEKNLYDKTLIVLCADHGESLGEHGEKSHGFFIYNATLHVPLIFHLPGARQRPRAITRLANLADLMPTVLDALGVAAPADVQGEDLLPWIEGKREPEPRNLYSESFLARLHFNWSQLRGIETERYHFIEAPKAELYDLIQDPGETQNLAAKKPAVCDELRASLHKIIAQYSASQELAEKTGLDPALMERLKSLGYAGFSGGGKEADDSLPLPDPKDRIQTYELFSDAMSESQHGQYEESAEKLATIIKSEPDLVPAHYILGLTYYRMGQYSLAIENLKRALRLSPDYALAAYNLGLAYGRSGDMDNAIVALKRTLELDGTNFDAAYNLGAAYLQKRMVREAAASFRQASTIAPDYAPPHKALGQVLLYQGQVDDAIEELRRAAALEPGDPSIHAFLAKALAAKGLDQDAQEERRRAQQERH